MKDLLGNSLSVGDYVVVSMVSGRAAVLYTGWIENIAEREDKPGHREHPINISIIWENRKWTKPITIVHTLSRIINLSAVSYNGNL